MPTAAAGPHDMGPLPLMLLLLASIAGFGALAWRKLAIVVALQPEPRLDAPWQRLRSVFTNGLLQRRMVQREWRPGLMHAVIFIGFITLLLRKLQLLAIGFFETATFPDAFGGPFAGFKDAIELAVTAAVLYAFYRRLVLRPTRLERNPEAWLVLSLIAVIMLSDLAFDAFRFARLATSVPGIAVERDHAFAGAWLADGAARLSAPSQELGYALAYWLQICVVFSFLVILPLGEHFHIVTALPALFFRRGTPARQVPAVDIDALLQATDESTMKAGVRTALDLSWKDALDVFTCTECGRCKDACPTHQSGKPLSQKAVNDSLKHHLMAQREAIVDHDPQNMLPALVEGVISAETLWSCTTCGYCEAACPIELEHLPRFFRLRQHQVLIAGVFPQPLKKAFEAWEVQGNAWGIAAEQRGDWARGLDVPLVRSAKDMAALDWLFYVGSAMSFDPRGKKIARAFVTVLQRAGVRFGILGPREGSTGECARRLGNEMLFQQLAGSLVATLNEIGAARIVTCDPHALNALRHELPAFGLSAQVVHHTAMIEELLQQGRIAVQSQAQRIIFHDPCYLGRHNGEFDAPRGLLHRLTGAPPLEFALSREKAQCCGAGGGRMWMEETTGRRMNEMRVEQAMVAEPAVIATACPYCAVMMHDGLAASAARATQSYDVAELVAAALTDAPAAAQRA
jgi:Fe-S oxidoreductase